MKAADLHKVWGAPDNSQLTSKQQSFRLPVHVAAKLNALADVFPNKTKTELVGDLLAVALEDVIRNLPGTPGRPVGEDPDMGQLFEESGLIAQFRRAANEHHRNLQKELGIKNAPALYSGNYVVSADEAKE